MGNLRVDVEYLSAGANRQTAAVDWNEDGIVAFGADTNLALWKPEDYQPMGIAALFSGHENAIKAVKFLPKSEGDSKTYLVTGANDQCLRLWSHTTSGFDNGATKCSQIVHAHAAPLNCIAALHQRGRPSPTSKIFATGAADASVKVWLFDGNQVSELQTIKTTPKFFPLSIALSTLGQDGEALVMAVAGTRDIIQIFVASSTANPEFHLQATLSGHEGWIRSLDFTWESTDPASDLILASASQDKYIRLWRFHQGTELPAAAANGGDPSLGAYLPGKSPSNKAHRLQAADNHFSITFEALLLGHEDWIYSAKWYLDLGTKQPKLLSASADNTLAVWSADPSSGIWVTNVRLGEISREKGATTATGSTGGFWTGLWGPRGASVICNGRTGSWRLWDQAVESQDQDRWVPRLGISGHTKAVAGIAWSGNGEFLLSTSADQTTRLHASWKEKVSGRKTWHEMARPQIHGYDLNCIDSLGNAKFVSGADEKLMRVFDEPKAVAKLLSKLCDIDISKDEERVAAMPDAANMPVLGLSNKAIDAVDDDVEISQSMAAASLDASDREALDPGSTVRKSALDIDHPPLEDSLSRHTLWPEIEKLYGHGYEISCLAVSHDGTLIASACKASSVNHAVIRLFETERWTEVKPPLTAHSLTTTRLRFSPDDKYLLSVGRDRQWFVFERDDQDKLSYKLLQSNPKGHSRMILDAAWAPLTDSLVFATAGREKQVKIWRRAPGDTPDAGITCITTIPESHPVTAIDFLHRVTTSGTLLLAVGTEVGKISIYCIDATSLNVTSTLDFQPDLCPGKAVLQLAWRPIQIATELAVAAEDTSLRVYSIVEGSS